MAYTAWERVRQLNENGEYKISGPSQPKEFDAGSNLEKACLDFLRNDCEGLRFDLSKFDCTDSDGNSVKSKMIPYNMEMDTDRLCLERTVHHFMETGSTNDAFCVYFCYLEMFMGKYGQSKKMIEMLAEFELNASSLLLSHRDHYSHSVYVFIIGMAIYHNSESFRKNYIRAHMHKESADIHEAANHFLKYWGLTALFHDIGYPFELPFEQVKSYFGNTLNGVPYLAYKGTDEFIKLPHKEAEYMKKILCTDKNIETITDVLAYNIEKRLGSVYGWTAEKIRNEILDIKPTNPEKFDGYMDHAFFSGILLYRQISEVLGFRGIDNTHIDCLTAVTLHNSMFKFGINKNDTPLPLELHPLAYLLMLSDELQCWDRKSYGQFSRRQIHPIWCDLNFEGEHITASYSFDKNNEVALIAEVEEIRKSRVKPKSAYCKMQALNGQQKSKFIRDIDEIININNDSVLKLDIKTDFIDSEKFGKRKVFLSQSNFIHLYRFAVIVHGRGKSEASDPSLSIEEKLKIFEDYFNKSSLEFKMSVIERTKKYDEYLNAVGLFYTDRDVDYEAADINELDEGLWDILGKLEHDRWNVEKHEMGWVKSSEYKKPFKEMLANAADDKTKKDISNMQTILRDKTRLHHLIDEPYEELDDKEKNKDKNHFDIMIRLLNESDGIHIYKMPYTNFYTD